MRVDDANAARLMSKPWPCSTAVQPQAKVVGFLLLVTLVAGCTSDRAAGPSLTSVTSAEPRGDVGAIAGLVVDDAQLPVADAEVRFADDAAARAVTDAKGRFRISDARPGSHTLVVERDGFKATTVTVAVVAAETVFTTVSLVEIPRPVPRVVSYQAEAIIELGVNALGVYYYDNSSGTQYRDIFYDLPGDAESAVVGLRWTASSAVSAKWMLLSVWLSDPQCRGWCKQAAEGVGRSPLTARVDDIPTARDDHWGLSLNPYVAIEPPCMIATLSSCADAPDAVAQIALDQRFELYTTLFFVDSAPSGFDPFPPS